MPPLNLKADKAVKAFATAKQCEELVKEGISQFQADGLLSGKNSESHVTFKLAPSFGSLTSEAFKTMDEQLKVTIAGTIKSLEKLMEAKQGQASWEDVVAVMTQNVLIEPFDKDVVVYDTYKRDSTDFCKFNGSPDPTTVEAVISWYKGQIADEDVLNASAIDNVILNILAKIVAETGATVSDPLNIVYKSENEEKTVVDIGILRFPDITNPYYKIYRIKVVAFRNCERIGPREINTNGLRLEFNLRKYRPRADVLAQMKPEVTKKAVDQANSMFD